MTPDALELDTKQRSSKHHLRTRSESVRLPATVVRELFNDRAPTWGRKYAPRGKLVWRLREFSLPLGTLVSPPDAVLDFGCGAGHLAGHLCEHGFDVTACDIAEKMIAAARGEFASTNIDWVTLSPEWIRLPFADQSFEAVVASSVLEYVEDVDLVFRELSRVLRDGGVLLFNVPNPHNARRRRERLIRALARIGWIRRAACALPRGRRYLRYLSLSRTRLPLREWRDRAHQFGLQEIEISGTRAASAPLSLIGLRKETGLVRTQSRPAMKAELGNPYIP